MKNTTTAKLLALCSVLAFAPPAIAQISTGGTGRTVMPYAGSGYVGLNLGRPEYDLACGRGGFACDDPDASVHIYTGGMFNQWLGGEIGYLRMGDMDRQGGTTRGHGINLSLIGRWPVSQSFNLFAKVGGTYSRTDITTSAASLEASGDASGWGLSYGVGVGYDFPNDWSIVLQWDRHEMKFAGRGRENADAASIGVRYRF